MGGGGKILKQARYYGSEKSVQIGKAVVPSRSEFHEIGSSRHAACSVS